MTESAVAHGDTLRGSPGTQPRLTPRELEVVTRLGNGETRESVAASMGITRRTVRTYCSNAQQKYDVRPTPGASGMFDLFRAMGWMVVP